MAGTMHKPPLHEGITGGVAVDGVGVPMTICDLYPFYSLVQIRRVRPWPEARQLGKYVIPVTGMNRRISIPMEDDSWDHPVTYPGR